MELHRFGELRARVVGNGDELIVVLLHGFGAPGDDLVSLAHGIAAPPGTRFVFPEAPISFYAGFGESRAWWMIDLERIQRMLMLGQLEELKREEPSGGDRVRAQLDGLLDAVQAPLPGRGQSHRPRRLLTGSDALRGSRAPERSSARRADALLSHDHVR